MIKWTEMIIETEDGKVKAVAPEIISASRSTDIPAWFAEWFIHRLNEGYVKWVNPFNQRPQYISFDNTRVVVFWSKNPKPLIPFLHELDRRGISYYFQFTLNDYEREKLEPNVPALEKRIETFQKLSEMIGKERVIWRFDPLILTDNINSDDLIEKIRRIGYQIAEYTQKLVFSFADISIYKKVVNNLRRLNVLYREFNDDDMVEIAGKIAELCIEWRINAATCAELIDLAEFKIEHNKCIDDNLILKIARNDDLIHRFLRGDEAKQVDFLETSKSNEKYLKDPGQREECGCVVSKDIGRYNTCSHLCTYCYANTSEKVVAKNSKLFSN